MNFRAPTKVLFGSWLFGAIRFRFRRLGGDLLLLGFVETSPLLFLYEMASD